MRRKTSTGFDDKAEIQEFESFALNLTLNTACRHFKLPTGIQRKPPVANSRLLEVQRVTRQRTFVAFAFAAYSDVRWSGPVG